jgi:predicted lipoprotein with Yx(FWY)xxD motif
VADTAEARYNSPVKIVALGIQGRFGRMRRPDGRLQVTHRGLPVYTYAHEEPEQVLATT